MEGGHRVNIWKTAEVTLIGSNKYHKTVAYFFKELIFSNVKLLISEKQPHYSAKGKSLFLFFH